MISYKPIKTMPENESKKQMNDSTPSGEIEHGLPKPKGNLIHRTLGGGFFVRGKHYKIYPSSTQKWCNDIKGDVSLFLCGKHRGVSVVL